MQNVRNWIYEHSIYFKKNLLASRLIAILSIDIFVKISGFILLPVYLRLMSQEEYGLYNYILSIILTFSVVLNFGLYIPLSKYYHQFNNPGERNRLIATIFILLSFFLAAIALIIFFFNVDKFIIALLFKNPLNYTKYRGLLLMAIGVSVFNFMLTNYFYTSENIKQLRNYNISRILLINLSAVITLFVIHSQNTAKIRLEATYFTELVLLIVFARPLFKKLKNKFDKALAYSGLKLALPVMLSAIFGILINFSDKFWLERYGSLIDLSYYYLAIACSSIISLIFASFQNAWLPLFMKEKDLTKNIAKTSKIIYRILFGFITLSVFIVLFVWILISFNIIPGKYRETLSILPLLLVSQIFASIVPLYSNYLIYFEKTYIASVTGLIMCFISFGAGFLLVPKFGIYGAGMVSILANMGYFIIYFIIIKMLLKEYQIKTEITA